MYLCAMYDLYIAIKNYSSWPLRPWALMRELGIPFREYLLPFKESLSRSDFRKDGEAVGW